jgi:hypothetical protein
MCHVGRPQMLLLQRVCESPTGVPWLQLALVSLQAIRSRQSRHVYVQALIARWLIVLAAGITIGIVAFFFNWVSGFYLL